MKGRNKPQVKIVAFIRNDTKCSMHPSQTCPVKFFLHIFYIIDE